MTIEEFEKLKLEIINNETHPIRLEILKEEIRKNIFDIDLRILELKNRKVELQLALVKLKGE